LTSDDLSDQTPSAAQPEAPAAPETDHQPVDNDAADEATETDNGVTDSRPEVPRQRILIGSQRDPAANRARQIRDWTPLPEPDQQKQTEESRPQSATPSAEAPSAEAPSAEAPQAQASPDQEKTLLSKPPRHKEEVVPQAAAVETTLEPEPEAKPSSSQHFPPPNIRGQLPPELEDEFEKALGDESLDDLLGDDGRSVQAILEEESQHTGSIVAIHGDDVFVELGSREQGCLSAKQFEEPPEVGTALEVIVQRFSPEDGLYDLTLPNKAVNVDDWADIQEGMLVDTRVTGHNTGGLECEVGHLRGFIPVSQIDLYRVEDLAQFVDEKFACLVTEANPQRRNLVLSRRAVLEREKAEAREQFIAALQPGQIHEGVVRKLLDFGAFVDIGGLDGLLHISQLAWGRVNHPNEVLEEGQKIKVKIEKIDHETGKMSLAYRDLLENPWDDAAKNFPTQSIVEGTVTKLMEFGAFVELERGVEGLVHISELSHKRVWRPSDVVHEGDKVQVMVLSVDTQAQRMSLSISQATAPPEPVKKEDEPEPLPAKSSKRRRPDKPLKGGLGRSTGDRDFGLKW